MRKLLLTLGLGAVGLAALAAPAASRAEPERPASPRRIFISPSGEPFRGKDGLDAWFAQADLDRDGSLNPAEFRADAERVFKLYDRNGDGVMDGSEVQAYEREAAPEITEMSVGLEGPDDGHRPRRRGRGRTGEPGAGGVAEIRGAGLTGAARFSLLNEPQPLLAADQDIDGKVTRQEWAQATTRRFSKLDRDKAGKLTLGDLRPPLRRR